MNLIAAIRNYVEKMIQECGPGIKLLLMDTETTAIISTVYAQSEIFNNEVFLFENINSLNKEEMKYVKCIAFLRPTKQNIQLLSNELLHPKYQSYYIYFTNVVNRSDLKILAESDEFEVVKEIKEMFGDFIAINSYTFSFNILQTYQRVTWYPPALERCVEGLASICLALKRKPAIRYQGNSELTLRLAEGFQRYVSKDAELFNFRHNDPPLLLILDRREDPVTPILHQWTYQAMVHDLIGINNNRVSLVTAPGVNKELKEVVLSPEHDEFYFENMYLNFGEIGQNIKVLMDEFQTKTKSHQKVESIADMKSFIENYPQFKKLSGRIAKHVTLLGELSRLVGVYKLLDLSEIEQNLACGSTDHYRLLQDIKELIKDQQVRDIDILKLVLLYALCYEKSPNNDTSGLIMALRKRGLPDNYTKMVHTILEFGGSAFRNNDLFGNQDPMAFTKKILKGLKGIENVYTQHKALIVDILEQIQKSKLRENLFPYFGNLRTNERPSEVIIFVAGGVTYEEILATYLFNKNNVNGPFPMQALIGGTTILNSNTFLETLEHFSPSHSAIQNL